MYRLPTERNNWSTPESKSTSDRVRRIECRYCRTFVFDFPENHDSGTSVYYREDVGRQPKSVQCPGLISLFLYLRYRTTLPHCFNVPFLCTRVLSILNNIGRSIRLLVIRLPCKEHNNGIRVVYLRVYIFLEGWWLIRVLFLICTIRYTHSFHPYSFSRSTRSQT